MSQQSTSLADPVETSGLSRPVRWLLKTVAVVSLVLAVVGAFLPIMPTVPFILLAAWAATRSSPRLSQWLENHPRMGPPIREWRQGGVVRRSAKWYATVMMSFSAVMLAIVARPWWVPVSAITVMSAVGLWLWQRPEHPPPQRTAGE
jgi:uncharacterized protein